METRVDPGYETLVIYLNILFAEYGMPIPMRLARCPLTLHLYLKRSSRVLPGLLLLMDDAANPRVQAHAGAALVNFSEGCPKNIMVPYLPDIMAKKFSLM